SRQKPSRAANRTTLLCLLLLFSLVILAACGGGAVSPEGGTEADTDATPAEAASTPDASDTESSTEEAAATPEPVADAAPTQDIIVPPPDIAEPGPVSTIMPMERNEMYDAAPDMEIDPSKFYYATLKTMRGDVKVQLFADRAPQTVNNFVFLARQGFYDNTS